MRIEGFDAMKVRDSRGDDTIAVFIKTSKGTVHSSSPSGKSRGKYEINQFSEKGIDFSVSFLKMLGKKLSERNIPLERFEDLKKVESLVKEFDKSLNFNFLGGNALFALESALLKAMALEKGKELWQFLNPKADSLPKQLGNVIGGGMHVKKNPKSDIQEFLICPNTRKFYDSYFISLQSYKALKKKMLEDDKGWVNELTDEKALATTLPTGYTLEMMRGSLKMIEKMYGFEVKIGMDMAASHLFDGKEYAYRNLPKKLDRRGQIDYVSKLIKKNDLFYVEDPMQEDDFEGFSELLKEVKKERCLIVGDDLTATNLERLKRAVKMKSINAVIIKPNQNGSLVRTKEVLDYAVENRIIPIISHRSGETHDAVIADLAVAWNIPYIKTGVLGKERLAKLHRLMQIERQLSAR